MGIYQSYRRISADDLQRLLSDREFAEHFLYGGDPLDDPDAYYDFIRNLEEKGRYLSIEKEWQALHFLITGEYTFAGNSRIEPPLCNVIMGGTNTPYESTYDYYRYLTPEEVKAVAVALDDIRPDDLRVRFRDRFAKTDDLYANEPPAQWDDEYWEYMLGVYEQLKNFFSGAAQQNEAMLISSD